jgi:hypothetical protein
MLDDVERRRFLVEPAREDAVPVLVRLLHVELDERAGQLLLFPGGGRLAGTQAHDHILPANRLAGMQRHRLDDAVALVEDAQHRDPLRHRRDAALAIGGRGGLARRGQWGVLPLLALAARGERKRGQQECGAQAHAYSGIQGS